MFRPEKYSAVYLSLVEIPKGFKQRAIFKDFENIPMLNFLSRLKNFNPVRIVDLFLNT